MAFEPHVSDITQVIQLAIAPVFMLTAIASLLNALLGRLGRAVDRRRVVEDRTDADGAAAHPYDMNELRLLARRIQLVIWSIAFAVFAALLVCLLIGAAFLGAYTALELTRTVAILFVASVGSLTVCLLLFMREVFLAALSVHNVRPRRGE
jgi:small-conductance mechanosensitive channel